MIGSKNVPPPRPKKFLDQVREVLRLKHYSIRTEQAYVDWIKRYILFHNKRRPREMGPREISAFLKPPRHRQAGRGEHTEPGPSCDFIAL